MEKALKTMTLPTTGEEAIVALTDRYGTDDLSLIATHSGIHRNTLNRWSQEDSNTRLTTASKIQLQRALGLERRNGNNVPVLLAEILEELRAIREQLAAGHDDQLKFGFP